MHLVKQTDLIVRETAARHILTAHIGQVTFQSVAVSIPVYRSMNNDEKLSTSCITNSSNAWRHVDNQQKTNLR